MMARDFKAKQIGLVVRRDSSLSFCNFDLLANVIHAVKIRKQKPSLAPALHNHSILFDIKFRFGTHLLWRAQNIDADIVDVIESIKNPTSGVIRCKGYKELIVDDNKRGEAKISVKD